MESGNLKTSESIVQGLSTFVICFLAIQTGFVYAWPSYNVASFMSNNTVLATQMGSMEISLLGSLPNIGGLAISPFCGWIFNTFGRKYATMMFGLPYVISWAIISLTGDVNLVLIAVAIAGVGIAGQNVSLIFISEIAHDSIRGGMTACSAAFFFLGILISYILGGNCSYMTVVFTHLTTSVITILLLALLPESPVFLILVGKEEEARKSISFYRRMDIKSKEMEAEVAKIKLMVDPRLEKILQAEDQDLETADKLMEKMDIDEEIKQESSWKFLMKSKSSKRALITVLILMAATIMMGCVVLQVYAEPLFAEAVPSMPASQCAIFIALDFLIASSLCAIVVDKFGRKSLLITTSAGSGICTAMLGSQLQFHWAPHWFTAALIYVYGFVYTVGCAVIPFILTAEVFLPEVRGFCNSMTFAFVWVFNFITLVIFNPLVDTVGLGPVFYLFSVVCFAGAVYAQFYLPETKGLSADAIQVLFLKQWGIRKSKVTRALPGMDSDKVTLRGGAVQCLASFARPARIPALWLLDHNNIADAVAALTCLTGLVFAWPSYNVANFVSNDTTLSRPMSSVDVSLLGSLTNIGAFIGTPIFGILMNKIGRKYTAMLAGLPFVLAWVILTLTNSVPLVLVAMFIAGVGTGGQGASSIYISEISQDSIRGALTSAVVSLYFIGLLISYILGGCLSYTMVVYVMLTLSIVYIVLLSLLKDSSVYLLQEGREKEAIQSIAFYRQTSTTSKEVEVEISKIKLQLDPKLEKILEGGEDPTLSKDLIDTTKQEEKLSEWQFLKQSQSSIRALIVSLVCLAIMMFMGNIALQVYAETLFKDAVPSLDSNQCSIYLALVLLVASVMCSLLIDRYGRKFLMIVTCTGSSVCTLILGTLVQFHWAPHWFTALLIYVYNFIFNIGIAVVPFVLIAELFLPEVRGLCSSIVMSSGWLLNFITLVIFTPVVEVYGLAPLFYAFSVVGFAGAIYCVFCQPETKGLSVDAIQGLFLKNTKRKVRV